MAILVKRIVSWTVLLGLTGFGVWLFWPHGDRRQDPRRGRDAGTPSPAVAPAAPRAEEDVGPIRYVVVAGGFDPASNQTSLLSDLSLAARTFGAGGRLLYAGGPGTRGVQVTDPTVNLDPLRARLARIFDPRGGRDARYDPVNVPVHGPATRDALWDTLDAALRDPSPDGLTLYLATHGEQGETPPDNQLRLWGQGPVNVWELAEALDAAPAGVPVRVVVTSCYGGGFADLLYRGGDAKRGEVAPDRCGLFATTWDRVASGCDPSPDRRAHQGYGVHFLHALAGQDRQGKPLSTLDLDGDGAVDGLEAHARARIASLGFGVPTATSELWLRQEAPPVTEEAPSLPVDLPEEKAVIMALSARLSVEPARAWEVLDTMLDELDLLQDQLEDTRVDLDRNWYRLSSAILARWPVLDDPYHPHYAETLKAEGPAILEFLESSDEALAWRTADGLLAALERRQDQLTLDSAPVERLARAWENHQLAGRLKAVGGAPWETYEALRACERGVTP